MDANHIDHRLQFLDDVILVVSEERLRHTRPNHRGAEVLPMLVFPAIGVVRVHFQPLDDEALDALGDIAEGSGEGVGVRRHC